MQSTGQASTQAVSFTPIHGSAITYTMPRSFLCSLSAVPPCGRKEGFRTRPRLYLIGWPVRSCEQVGTAHSSSASLKFLPPAFEQSPKSSPSLPERSEEHTSELQSLRHLVCRLLLEKK